MFTSRPRITLLFAIMITTFAESANAEPMLATWYACPFSADCVANRHYQKGTVLQLFNPRTGRSARGVVRDYGPAVWTGRSLDVSRQIAGQLGMTRDGVAWLEVSIIRQ